MSLTRYEYTPSSFEEAMKMAELISASDLIPADYKGKPGNVFLAMQLGHEIGVAPMQAIQNIAVINGRPCIWGDLLAALARSHPQFESMTESFTGEGDEFRAVCQIKRKNNKEHVSSFGYKDAVQAKLWNKAGPWSNYPKRMLQMRARAFAIRDQFPDALRGLSSAEEMRDITPVELNQPVIAPPSLDYQPTRAVDLRETLIAELSTVKVEALKEVYKKAYQLAKSEKDADFYKKIKAIYDQRSQELQREEGAPLNESV
jgi:hypothetical protein